MNWALVIAFLFAAGSLIGWCLEFGFRNLISHKGPRLGFVINPGFCKGPYLPIYGFGVVVMFLISYLLTPQHGQILMVPIIIGIGLAMSLIEFIGGFLLLKALNMRLWDYRHLKGNIMGFICPQFAVIWMALGAVYYIFIHPLMIEWLIWLSNNLAFSFMIGLFFGLFIPDLVLSSQEAAIIREFANDEAVVVKYEELKALMQKHRLENAQKARFFNQVRGNDSDLREFLKEHKEDVAK